MCCTACGAPAPLHGTVVSLCVRGARRPGARSAQVADRGHPPGRGTRSGSAYAARPAGPRADGGRPELGCSCGTVLCVPVDRAATGRLGRTPGTRVSGPPGPSRSGTARDAGHRRRPVSAQGWVTGTSAAPSSGALAVRHRTPARPASSSRWIRTAGPASARDVECWADRDGGVRDLRLLLPRRVTPRRPAPAPIRWASRSSSSNLECAAPVNAPAVALDATAG